MVVKVGIRELRENLRACLERVKEGDELVVTERGRPIARVSRPETDEEHIARLIRQEPSRLPDGRSSRSTSRRGSHGRPRRRP